MTVSLQEQKGRASEVTVTFTYEELLRLSEMLQKARGEGVMARKVERALRLVEDGAS